jgi:hypothetical protein
MVRELLEAPGGIPFQRGLADTVQGGRRIVGSGWAAVSPDRVGTVHARQVGYVCVVSRPQPCPLEVPGPCVLR